MGNRYREMRNESRLFVGKILARVGKQQDPNSASRHHRVESRLRGGRDQRGRYIEEKRYELQPDGKKAMVARLNQGNRGGSGKKKIAGKEKNCGKHRKTREEDRESGSGHNLGGRKRFQPHEGGIVTIQNPPANCFGAKKKCRCIAVWKMSEKGRRGHHRIPKGEK